MSLHGRRGQRTLYAAILWAAEEIGCLRRLSDQGSTQDHKVKGEAMPPLSVSSKGCPTY